MLIFGREQNNCIYPNYQNHNVYLLVNIYYDFPTNRRAVSFVSLSNLHHIKQDNYLNNFFLNGEYSPFMGWVVGVVLEALNRTRIIQNGFLNNCYVNYTKITVLYKATVIFRNVKNLRGGSGAFLIYY